MNGNVHKAIAEASRLLLSSEYRDFLDEKIDFAKWQKVCQELMIQDNGGISEDSTSLFKFQFDSLLSMIFEKAIWIMASEDSE